MNAPQYNGLHGLIRKMARKRVIVFGVGILVVAVAISAYLFDKHARREVKARVEAKYFAGISKYVVETVKKELRESGCNEQKGIAAAREFLNRERRHLALIVTYEPECGWQVQRFQFAIRWNSATIASFRLDKAYKPIVDQKGSAFQDKIEEVVCRPACGRLKCLWNRMRKAWSAAYESSGMYHGRHGPLRLNLEFFGSASV